MADHRAAAVAVVDDGDESNVVAKFLLNTCLLHQPTEQHLHAAVVCAMFATVEVRSSPHTNLVDSTSVHDVYHLIPLVTGSCAEFYIRPMLSCVGDVDIMFHHSVELALPEGYRLPTELPAEINSRLELHEILDGEHAGYVYMASSYLLTEDCDTGKYNAVRSDERRYIYRHVPSPEAEPGAEVHGPAVTFIGRGTLSYDRVFCVRCLSWPSQASDWPTRHRNYGWPDSATVDRVVSSGCDVVRVTHRLCKEDEWKRKYQWRLSFSRAEIVLLNSWMPVQQIVYHMLRFFVRTEHSINITDSSGSKILCNYHLKTLTLWACEMTPKRWWTDDMNVVRICVQLLHNLSDWLKNKICPHYFVSSCSLFHNTLHSDLLASQLDSIYETWLSTWFVNKYLRKCAQLCSNRVSRLFDDVSTSTKLQSAVSAVVDWRRKSVLSNLRYVCFLAKYDVPFFISKLSLAVWSCDYWISGLTKVDLCLFDYFTAVTFLHVASRVAKHSLSDQLMDVLATLVGQFVGKRRYCPQLSSDLSLSQAVILMKAVANNSHSTVQQMQFELSKAYLYRALRYKDSDSDTIYCLANVYLAVLYYIAGQYQTAIDHCTLVMRSQDHSQCSSRVVQGEILPKIDDDIDTVLGLAVFYQYVRTAALNHQQTQYVVVFTTELFAHYLYMRSLSVTKCCRFTDEVKQHTKYVYAADQMLTADVLLLNWMNVSKHKCHCKPLSERALCSVTNATELDTSELAELLRQSAVEHLTTYRQLEAQNFLAAATIVTTDFEALHTYKRGDYQRCLQLCTRNVRTLLYADDMPDVWTFPEFLQLMDNDIASLTALTLIVSPECRQWYQNVGIGQLTLSLYLMTQCQLKLRHPVTSLAQTLDYIEVTQRGYPTNQILDHLILKLTERKLMIYLSENT